MMCCEATRLPFREATRDIRRYAEKDASCGGAGKIRIRKVFPVVGDDVVPFASEEVFDQSMFPGWREPGFTIAKDIELQGSGSSRPKVNKGSGGSAFPVGLNGGGAERGGGFNSHIITDA